MTEPVAWPTLDAIEIRELTKRESPAARMEFEPIPGKRIFYRDTTFADMEGSLKNLDAEPL